MFELPHDVGWTVYGKTGCRNCTTAIHAIEAYFHANEVTYINLDEPISIDRDGVLNMFSVLTGSRPIAYPIIFYRSIHIGGLSQLIKYLTSLPPLDND
jgi:glutaredoxin